MPDKITVEVLVDADVESAWQAFVAPGAVVEWNFASPEWYCPRAASDLRVGGSFAYRMEARDGSAGFDFSGEYTVIVPHALIGYRLGDGREVVVEFRDEQGRTRVRERFDAESAHSRELQQAGWQAILDNYKRYAESRA